MTTSSSAEKEQPAAAQDSYWLKKVEEDLANLYASVFIAYGQKAAHSMIDKIGDLFTIESPD